MRSCWCGRKRNKIFEQYEKKRSSTREGVKPINPFVEKSLTLARVDHEKPTAPQEHVGSMRSKLGSCKSNCKDSSEFNSYAIYLCYCPAKGFQLTHAIVFVKIKKFVGRIAIVVQ
jgi:hypothetical protein